MEIIGGLLILLIYISLFAGLCYLIYQLVAWLCYLVHQLFVLYIIPGVLWLLTAISYTYVAILAIPVVCSALIAIGCYINSLIDSIDYVKQEIKKIPPDQKEPARRRHCLKPKLLGLVFSIKNSFYLVIDIIGKFASWGGSLVHFDDKNIIISILSIVFGITWVFGSCTGGFISFIFVTLIVVFIHIPIFLMCQLVILMAFCVVKALDYMYLMLKRIKSDCPNCHERHLIPTFICPSCKRKHFELVPNFFGIFHHECQCGQELPSTFLSGRSKLESCCPKCEADLFSSDARPIAIQLIGGTASGKTIYLAAFFELFKEIIRKKNLLIIDDESCKPDFDKLSNYYNGRDCESSSELNSKMYPVIIDNVNGNSKRQFSIYDIAGEMFDGNTANNQIPQKQFEYCDGFLLFIDPYVSSKARQNKDTQQTIFSSIPLNNVIGNFDNYLIHFGMKKPDERCQIPISVIIGKIDVDSLGEKLLNDCKGKSYEEHDELCKEYLRHKDIGGVINQLDTIFTDIHYFPVSSIGHSPNGNKFEPQGVLEPIEAILERVDYDLYKQLRND